MVFYLANRAFYRYAAILCVVNLLEAIGSLLVYSRKFYGLWYVSRNSNIHFFKFNFLTVFFFFSILNVAVLLFYSLFAPLIYFTFLRKSFRYGINRHIEINLLKTAFIYLMVLGRMCTSPL